MTVSSAGRGSGKHHSGRSGPGAGRADCKGELIMKPQYALLAMSVLVSVPLAHGDPPLDENGSKARPQEEPREASGSQDEGGGQTPSRDSFRGESRSRSLVDAARNGDIPEIQAQLLQAAEINALDERTGMTPLLWAIKDADAETVRLLIEAGADAHMRSESGRTALYLAMSNPRHRVAIVRLLLAKGAKPSVQESPEEWWLDIYGRALQTGAESEIFQLFLDWGLDPNPPDEWSWQPLSKAAAYGRADVVELLLDRGAAIDTHSGSEKTVLMHAAGAMHPLKSDPIRTLQLLLEAGADKQIQQADREGLTALHYAAETAGPFTAAKIALLLKVGAEVDARSKEGRTPLMLVALNSSDASPVEILLQAGADPNMQDDRGFTPLHWAIHWGPRMPNHLAIYRLLETGAEVNEATDAGWTPLMEACRMSDSKSVALLLDRGADPNLQNDNGWTALMIVLANNNREIWMRWLRDEEWLVQPGRPMSEEDARFLTTTLIGDGSANGQVGIVWNLLAEGAEADIRAKDGTTAYTLLEERDEPSATAIRRLMEQDLREAE